MSECEEIFKEDVKIKKMISHKPYKSGKIITPIDMLKGKAKKEYMGNSKVIKYKLNGAP